MSRCFNPDLFIAGLPIETTSAELAEIFAGINIEMDFAELMRNRSMGRERMKTAIAFLRLKDKTKAEAAIDLLNGAERDGCKIVVRKYTPKPKATFRSPAHPWNAHYAGETETEAGQ
jgi:hypothetical protein